MRTAAALGAILLGGAVATDFIPGDGSITNGITCKGFPGSFSYKKAVGMRPDGNCDFEDYTAEGPLAPLTDAMQHIFRGPANLEEFHVYKQTAGKKRRGLRPSVMERRHSHQRFHEKNKEKRAVGDKVTAIIDGKEVSWINTYDPNAAPAPAVPAPAAPAPAAPAPAAPATPATPAAPVGGDSKPAPKVKVAKGDWARVAHYNQKSKTADGVTFLANNNFTPNMALGFIPGYVASDAKTKADAPQTLDGYIPDNFEVILASDRKCSDSDPCGSVAPGSVAYHGWDGDRVVIAKFTFPDSGCTAASDKCPAGLVGMGNNWNMPAWWSLADTMVHNLQYGASGCNSWKKGAGELDIHEVLEVGGNKGFLSFHMGNHYAGTPPQAFARPFTQAMTLAVIISGETFRAQVVEDGTDLGDSLSAETITSWINSEKKPIGNSFLASAKSFSSNVFDVILSPGVSEV